MAVRKENHRQKVPSPRRVYGCHWDLILPMLEKHSSKQPDENDPDCWAVVKDITHSTREDGNESLTWIVEGVSFFGPYERQETAHKSVCPVCGHAAADLPSHGSTLQRCCGSCRLNHDRALARLAARRRRRAKGEVTTPGVKACEVCGSPFNPERSTAKFCSTKCRVAAYRSKATA